MQVGDLVRNLNSESGLLGVVVDWTDTKWPDNNQCSKHPIIHWNDGRTGWIMAQCVEVINESR